jgi:hypothetical protein
MRFTGAKTKQEAVVRALEELNRRRRVAELVKHFGKLRSLATNEEIEAEQAQGQEKTIRGAH